MIARIVGAKIQFASNDRTRGDLRGTDQFDIEQLEIYFSRIPRLFAAGMENFPENR